MMAATLAAAAVVLVTVPSPTTTVQRRGYSTSLTNQGLTFTGNETTAPSQKSPTHQSPPARRGSLPKALTGAATITCQTRGPRPAVFEASEVPPDCLVAAAPGAVPARGVAPALTLGQVQTAFLELPFARPRVAVQPVGNVTLVNLPTYYQVQWSEAGLAPGDVSGPVRILSWTVEFRIAIDSYTYRFGDGNSSKPTTDPGGSYPNGKVRHTYLKTQKRAPVKVDAELVGQYRVDGGPWQPLPGVADLQNEPVTTLQVKQARARLIG